MKKALLAVILVFITFNATAQNEVPLKPFKENRMWGFTDLSGNVVIPAIYQDVHYKNYSGRLVVQKDKKWGFIDRTNKEITPFVYDQVIYCNNSWWSVRIGKKWGFVNILGKEIIPVLYDDYWPKNFSTDDPIWIKSGKKWALFGRNGKEILPPTYDDIRSFTNGFAQVMLTKKWGLVDTSGQEILPPIFQTQALGILPEGLVVVTDKYGLHFGLADLNGKMILPAKYSYIEKFSSNGQAIIGIAKVKSDWMDTMAAINSTKIYTYGEVFQIITYVPDPDVKIRSREIVSEGVIDITGKIIIPVKNGQLLIRQENGTFEIYEARKTKGSYDTEYISTGKFYDAGGKLIKN